MPEIRPGTPLLLWLVLTLNILELIVLITAASFHFLNTQIYVTGA
jgi:hypothetical protein